MGTQTLDRDINCDQVAWIKDALWRYKQAINLAIGFNRTSKLEKVAETACLIEIMEIVGLIFADDAARMNAVASFLNKTSEECSNINITAKEPQTKG